VVDLKTGRDASPTGFARAIGQYGYALQAAWYLAGARAVLREAGQRTAEYLLANRIPRPAQWLLRVLPASIGMRLLSRAMAQHAWTFAGSGHFRVRFGRPPEFTIDDCPLCRGLALEAPEATRHRVN
jgi:divinyl protochlorophyllide a 8-vinyl-reductase